MYILILFFPFMGAILGGLFGRYLGRKGSSDITIWNSFITLILSLFIFYEVGLGQAIVSIKLYNFIIIDIYQIEIGLLFDTISVSMVLVINCISFFVHLYASTYMSHDPHLSRFMSYLSLFTFFMLVLVTSDNYFQIFIGWEGVGLCSYLLINFFFTRILANKAGLNALIMNRIADVFFIFAIIYMFIIFKTTDIIIILNLLPFIANENILFLNFYINKIDFIAFFLFIGAIGKSAQIGFHTWLPKAMEGPTPVSALLHAATMVTAGVFLVIRSSLFFEYSAICLTLLCIFGSITALFSGLIAIFQNDIKKIIAYSTCSQLGYMFIACGFSNYHVAFFHLFNHAFFKALLFLSAGIIIHVFFDEQDIRKIGYLYLSMPYSYIAFLIGSLAILGFPGLAGFYSKDLLLELCYSRYTINSLIIYLLAVLAAFCTLIYSTKIMYYLFLHQFKNNYAYVIEVMYREKKYMAVWNRMYTSITYLIFFSIMSGGLFSDIFVGVGTPFWNNTLHFFNGNFYFIEVDYVHPLIKNMPIILSIMLFFFFFFAFELLILRQRLFHSMFRMPFWQYYCASWTLSKYFYKYRIDLKLPSFFCKFNKLAPYFYYGLFFDKFYNKIYQNLLITSYFVFTKSIDKGLLELFGPWGLYKVSKNITVILKQAMPNIFSYYIFMFFLCFLFFLLIVFIDFSIFNLGFFWRYIGIIFIFFFILNL